MKLIEELKAALAVMPAGEVRYDKDLSAIVRLNVAKHRVEAVADFGKIDNPDETAHLIALLHNHAEALIEAAVCLKHLVEEGERSEYVPVARLLLRKFK